MVRVIVIALMLMAPVAWGQSLSSSSSSDEVVDMGDDNAFSFGDGSTDDPFSMTAWVRRASSSASAGSIAAKFNGGAGAAREWIFQTEANDLLLILLRDESAAATLQIISVNPIEEIKWTHVAFTYDGSGTAGGLTLYTNGLVFASADVSAGSYTAMENTTSDLLLLSQEGDGSIVNNWNGDVIDWRLFSRELSAADVLSIRNGGKLYDGLVFQHLGNAHIEPPEEIPAGTTLRSAFGDHAGTVRNDSGESVKSQPSPKTFRAKGVTY